MRKSFKVAPGVRLNVSKTGVGASVGGRGGRYSVHSSGRRTVTAGSGIIPGVYYQQSVGGGSRSRAQSHVPPVASPPRPGLFAPKGEKNLYNALKAHDIPMIKAVGVEYPEYRVASYTLVGLLLLSDDTPQAKRLLTIVFDSGRDPAADAFISKYQWQGWRAAINIAVGVKTELPINRDAVGLALAEIRQHEGDFLAQGKKGMARKDLERILAEDSDYANVRERLAELTSEA